MIDGEALGGRPPNPDNSWHIIPGFPETGRRGLLNQHFNQYTNLVKGSAACSWANAPLKWQESPVPGNHLRRIFYGVPRASSLLPSQMSRVSVNCLALGSTWTRLIEITQKPDEESLSINCCGMFEYGCPGRVNGSADQRRRGWAGPGWPRTGVPSSEHWQLWMWRGWKGRDWWALRSVWRLGALAGPGRGSRWHCRLREWEWDCRLSD